MSTSDMGLHISVIYKSLIAECTFYFEFIIVRSNMGFLGFLTTSSNLELF